MVQIVKISRGTALILGRSSSADKAIRFEINCEEAGACDVSVGDPAANTVYPTTLRDGGVVVEGSYVAIEVRQSAPQNDYWVAFRAV